MENKGEIVIYQSKNGKAYLEVKLEQDTVWLNLNQMARLFRKTVPNISMHIKNVFREKELDRFSTVKDSLIVQIEGGRNITRSIEHYNLDVIISVGYRIKSKEGVLFRKWATQVLRNHILNGYTLNRDRLKELENLYHCLSDTMTVTTMNLNKLRIDSARQKDFAVLAEDVECMKRDIDNLRKKLL